MKIKYEFVTGESVEIEVPDDIGEVSIEIDRVIYNSDHRETRRHNSVENLQEKGIHLVDQRVDVVSTIESLETNESLHNALIRLLPQQQELIKKVFIEGRSMASIAREEGVTAKAIQDRVNKIKRRLKKIIKKDLF
ncbi:sigma factor-like helix-turn-helix DNA-binding protein [Desulfosporosinus sp.]|uniref:sigma factor-like helix-turn-helix DNA-binding protein n=1 Tax=Desulfosporosinus sp. TaxID=157907 RepID=UPI0025B7EC82|nr:sigma factor-like helix-turn-helix DNA-binding protein [Desulfosporosinus sp.]MBC2727103.1 sigma-70 family RNA polymerase sigma factor [Desulfosporosinus sp.]